MLARICAWFCAKIAFGECPWLLLWFHHHWWNGGLIGGQWPPNETAVWFQKALDWICGYDRRSGRRIETAELDLMHLLFSGLILRFNRRPGRRIETVEWDILGRFLFGILIGGFVDRRIWSPIDPLLLGFNSAVEFCGHDRRMKPPIGDFKGILVFSHALFLMAINITLSLFSYLVLWLKRTLNLKERFLRENQIKNSFLYTQTIHMCIKDHLSIF